MLRNRSLVDMHSLSVSSGPELRIVIGLALVLETQLLSLSHRPKDSVSDDFHLHISQTSLALICRVSRSVFSECIARLTKAGWVTPNYGMLKFLQVRKWMLFCESYRSNRFNEQKSSIGETIVSMDLADAEEIVAMAITRQISIGSEPNNDEVGNV